jgi:hypothetical protein
MRSGRSPRAEAVEDEPQNFECVASPGRRSKEDGGQDDTGEDQQRDAPDQVWQNWGLRKHDPAT